MGVLSVLWGCSSAQQAWLLPGRASQQRMASRKASVAPQPRLAPDGVAASWVLSVTHRSSSRLISITEQLYNAAKSALFISKDLKGSVRVFEITVGVTAQLF